VHIFENKTNFCRLKSILYWLFGPKNQSFRNKSGKTQPIRTKFGIRGQVKGWQRSGNFARDPPILEKKAAGTSPAEPEFFCLVNHATFRQLRNGRFSPHLVTKRSSVSRRGIRKDIFENFHFRGHLSPKSEIENRSNRHLTQSRLQVTGYTAERYCLHHVVVLGPGISEVWSTFVCDVRLRSYGASKLPKFSNFGQFSHTKPLKRTFRWPAYSPRVTTQNDYDFSVL